MNTEFLTDRPCHTDDAGFHVEARVSGLALRTTKRYGIDAYAYRCQVCGVVGDIKEGRFVPR